MIQIVITGCGILLLGSSVAVFCCLRVGALYEKALLAQPPALTGKEDTEHGKESESGQCALCGQ